MFLRIILLVCLCCAAAHAATLPEQLPPTWLTNVISAEATSNQNQLLLQHRKTAKTSKYGPNGQPAADATSGQATGQATTKTGTSSSSTQHIAAVTQQQQAPRHNAAADAAERGHVKPLWPLDGIDIAVMAIVLFSLSLAGGAGIGGGAILVPIYLMLRGWPTAIAVALSNVTILGGSLANFICNVTRHRPSGKRTIDWELILMMEPTTIAGALLGAVLNKLLPNWITTYLLALLLSFMALRLYTKGKQAYAKETQLLQVAKAAARERRHLEHHRTGSTLRQAQHKHAAAAAAAPAGSADVEATSGGNTQQDHASAADQDAAAENQTHAQAIRRRLAGHGSKDVLSRSFSRLRGDLVLGVDASGSPAPAASPAFRSGSISSAAAWREAGARRPSLAASLRQSSTVGGSAAAAAAAAAVAAVDEEQGSRHVGAQESTVVVGEYARNTLFQGDVIDDYEPIIAMPPSDELSSESSLNSNGEESWTASGGGGAAAASDGDGDDTSDLYKPLLEPASAPSLSSKPIVHEPSLPLPHFFTLVGLSAWVVAADIAQDSFRCGSWQYWTAQLSVLIPVVVILGVFRKVLLNKYHHDDLPPGHELPEGELHWTARTTILYPLLCSSAGLIAGLFGIGGGVVKGPLMLELGVPADVAAATSATMIMFTAGSACIVYSRFGHILHDYAVVLLVLGFCVTLCSQLLTFVLIKLLGRRSIIVFMMVALMAAATAIMYVQSGLVTRDLIHHPEDMWKFGSICPTAEGGNLLQRLLHAVLPLA